MFYYFFKFYSLEVIFPCLKFLQANDYYLLLLLGTSTVMLSHKHSLNSEIQMFRPKTSLTLFKLVSDWKYAWQKDSISYLLLHNKLTQNLDLVI